MIKEWMRLFADKINESFAGRIEFIGLQGSHGRGEATEESDIDAVVILDRLDYADLKRYDEAISELPERHKICGFISGKDELLSWDRADLFQFYHDTLAVEGNLDFIKDMISDEDIRRAVHLGGCNIYHMCVHNAVHEKSVDVLEGLLKSSVFVLQAKHYLDTGVYVKRSRELCKALMGRDREVLEARMAGARSFDFHKVSKLIMEWSQSLVIKYGAGIVEPEPVIEFLPVKLNESEKIEELSVFASRIVKEHFDGIIGAEQNDYMIERFQSVEGITGQLKEGYRYYIVKLCEKNCPKAGFMAYYPKGGKMYLSKFYTASEYRGRHLARRMLSFIIEEARREGLPAVYLNVNRNNLDVISIYKHLGFKIIGDEKNHIGCGFVMDDYVMEYEI